MLKFNYEYLRIAAVYIFLISGGTWSILGKYSEDIKYCSALIMVGLAVAVVVELLLKNGFRHQLKFYTFLLFVSIISFFVDVVGFSTGFLYNANNILSVIRPIFWGVPLLIGTSWIIAFLLLYNLIECYEEKKQKHYSYISKAIVLSLLVNVFGIVNEYTSFKLGYCNLDFSFRYYMNYLVWFIEGVTIGIVFYRLKLNVIRPVYTLTHYLIAHIIYFTLCCL